MDFACFAARLAAAGIPRFVERRRDDLCAADFRAASFLELFRAGDLRAGDLRAAVFLRAGAAFRAAARFRPDARLREPPRAVDVFLALLFRPPLELPRDDFLAAAMM